jgi:hypothetical protein
MLLKKGQEKGCEECGRSIMGRIDKRFCSDQCRNTFNNRLNGHATNYIRNVNRALRMNRRILIGLNPEGKPRQAAISFWLRASTFHALRVHIQLRKDHNIFIVTNKAIYP